MSDTKLTRGNMLMILPQCVATARIALEKERGSCVCKSCTSDNAYLAQESC